MELKHTAAQSALAATTLTHQTQSLAFVELKTHSIDCLDVARVHAANETGVKREILGKVF